MNVIIEDANNERNINNNNNMLHLIPIATFPLIALRESDAKKLLINLTMILVAIFILYLFNLFIENIGNQSDELRKELKTKNEEIEKLTKLLQKEEEANPETNPEAKPEAKEKEE